MRRIATEGRTGRARATPEGRTCRNRTAGTTTGAATGTGRRRRTAGRRIPDSTRPRTAGERPPTDSSPAPPVAWGADGGAPPEPFGAGRGWQSPQWGNPPGLHGSATGFAPTTHPGSPLPGASYADAPLPGTAYPGPPYPGTEYPGSQSPGTSYLGSPDRAVGPHGERLAPPTPIPGTSTGFSASRAFGATLGHLVTVLAAFFLGGILLTITTHLVFFWFADGPSPSNVRVCSPSSFSSRP